MREKKIYRVFELADYVPGVVFGRSFHSLRCARAVANTTAIETGHDTVVCNDNGLLSDGTPLIGVIRAVYKHTPDGVREIMVSE